ncbi:MAG: 1-acyl-sn-glycerol-3-phosphate acyltransferase [Porphyromonas sp.]|nr:1-acyl-sn-glycerol-3-phosphate acyltransferase [Porphyromonas sp.]
MKKLAAWLLTRLGWRCLPALDEQPTHSIICVAPHTSNTDFLIGKLYYTTIGKPHGFLMKKDWFFFPLGSIFRAMGGIPVDRSRKGDMVERLAEYIGTQQEVHIAITPEGTRSYRQDWKTGFYRIALAAGIPIELAVLDYEQREVGIFEVFHPTGDMEADIAYIRSRYSSRQAKYPNKYHDYVSE